MTEKLTNTELKQWLAGRKEAGKRIDVTTCEIMWKYGQVADPYRVHELTPEEQQVGRLVFVRSPESGGWVSEHDLPTESVRALDQRIDREGIPDDTTTKDFARDEVARFVWEKIIHEIALGCKANRPRELIIADAARDLRAAFPLFDFETAEQIVDGLLHLCRKNRKLMDDLSNMPPPPGSSRQ